MPDHATGLYWHVLPEELTAAIDWTTLELVTGELADLFLQQRHTDLLFTARLVASGDLIYLLLEHRSGPVRWTALHLLGYVTRIAEHQRRQGQRAPLLDAIVPVVLHHGRRPWTAPRDVAGLCRRLPYAATEGVPSLRMGYLLDDLAATTEASVRARPMSALGRLALICLQFVHGSTPEAALATIRRNLDLMAAAVEEPGGQDGLTAINSYILKVTQLPMSALQSIIDETDNPALEENMISTAQRIAMDTTAAMLLRQLEIRFGPLPQGAIDRVRNGSKRELDRWVARVLTAESIDDLFA
jgi:hypothetical protein